MALCFWTLLISLVFGTSVMARGVGDLFVADSGKSFKNRLNGLDDF